MSYDQDYIDALKQELDAEAAKRSTKVPYITFKDGPNQIRILPALPDRKDFFLKRRVAYKVGPKEKMVVPPYQDGKPDPYKDYYESLLKAGDEVSRKEASKIRDNDQYFLLVINRTCEEKGVHQWSLRFNQFRDIVGLMSDPEYGDITHPEKGVDLVVTYTSREKSNKKHAETSFHAKRNATPLGTPEQMKEWLGKDWFKSGRIGEASDPEYIRAVLSGKIDEFFEAKKRARENQNPAADSAPSPNQAVPHNEAAYMEKKLEEMKVKVDPKV